MSRVLIPLAEGVEELEAVTLIDILRRGDIEVIAAGLAPGHVRGARGTVLMPDMSLDAALNHEYDMVVLPGGQPGATHLADDARIHTLLQNMAAAGKHTAAICAAPKVLALAGLLDGRRATAYPGTLKQHEFPAIDILDAPVISDETVITSRGPGTAMDFALTLVETLAGRARRDEVESALMRS